MLKIFFGYAAGVGKTYSMLRAAHAAQELGHKLVVGYVEPHPRPETAALLDGLALVPPLLQNHRGLTLSELNVLTHKAILQAVWGNTLAQSLPSLRVFMATLRKKLEAASPQCNCIRTHVGIGYRMSRGEA